MKNDRRGFLASVASLGLARTGWASQSAAERSVATGSPTTLRDQGALPFSYLRGEPRCGKI
jgi:hypothetical protein